MKHKIENSKKTPSFSPEKEGRVTAAFQGGAFSLLPPGSNCLFCSLNVSSLRLSGVAAVEEMPAIVTVLFSRLVLDEIFPFLLESTPMVKMPKAVIRPCSQIPWFRGQCCPGVSRPVPADYDLSFSNSGSISLSLFSKLKYTTDGGSGVC